MKINLCKFYIFIFILFVVLFITSCAAPKQLSVPEQNDTQSIRIRVLSYNMHYARSTYNLPNLKRIAKVILAIKPDIVALQEVDRGRPRSFWVNQLAELERLTGFTGIFGPNETFDVILNRGGQYGNAILSRFPVLNYRNHFLPNFYGGQRGILEAEIFIPKELGYLRSDFQFSFFSTHLQPSTKAILDRIVAADSIETIVQSMLGTPMILAGDINDTTGSIAISKFENIWGIVSDKDTLKTFPSINPRKQIDYVMFHPKNSWKVVEAYVIPERIASDHRPILVVLEWIGDSKAKN